MSRVVKGECWTVSTKAKTEFKANWIRGEPKRGLSRNLDSINTGQNSGYQAIGLAYLWGARRILLLGYDFKIHGGRRHWHPDHPGNMGNVGGNLAQWAVSMGELADDLKKEGVEVVNCSRVTALRCFPRSTITEQLEGIK